MVYTKKTPMTFILGVIMLVYGLTVRSGVLDALLKQSGQIKNSDEMIYMALTAGVIGIVVGLWQMIGSAGEGQMDYYLSTVGGALFILFVAFFVKWWFAPEIKVFSKYVGKIDWMGGKYFHKIFGLNYIVLGIITGILIVNTTGVPKWAENGVRLSRLGLKSGVILLGTLYSFAELTKLLGVSIVLIGIFVLGSVWMVLWLGSRKKIPNSMAGVLSAGMGVCGVSATVAAAPVVVAKSTEIAYTIGTILLWGVFMMFLFPLIGNALELSYAQFGAWAGTGILNSAQVAGAALSYQPDGIETLKVAEVFNITRVLFLPIIVLWLAIWYVKRESTGEKVDIGKVIIGKFPLFVLGFIILFALASTGIFYPANHYKGKYFDNTKVKESKMMTDAQVAKLKSEVDKVEDLDHKGAMSRLIENRKVMSEKDDAHIRTLVLKKKVLSKDVRKILKKAHKAVRHTSKRVKKFRQLIVWFFAFGLIGLGMQITFSSIKQAGGQPLVIGTIVGTIKAAASLAVIYFLTDFAFLS